METKTVLLNIGGVRYETTRTTLEKLKYFEMLLKHHSDSEKELFIDRDGPLFRFILFAIRNNCFYQTSPTPDVPDELWKSELDFYGLVSETVEGSVDEGELIADAKRSYEKRKSAYIKLIKECLSTTRYLDLTKREGSFNDWLEIYHIEFEQYAETLGYDVWFIRANCKYCSMSIRYKPLL